MAIIGAFDVHRRQVTYDVLDTVSGQVHRGQVRPACRATLRQFVAAYQGVNLSDPTQAQAFAQKVQPLTQQLAASGQKIDQYLQSHCGLSVGDTGSASPSS